MNLLSSFNRIGQTVAWNGGRPFVFVYIGDDDPARGDTHGYIGLAKRVAGKAGAEFMFLDKEGLEKLYPEAAASDRHDGEHECLMRLFAEKGFPDFIFSRNLPYRTMTEVNRHGTGLLVQSINERIFDMLFSVRALFKSHLRAVVPHHLSPEMLVWEGEKFAREYGELPRPFIGVNLSGLHYDEYLSLGQKLVGLKDSYDRASIFICSCHRTSAGHQAELMKMLGEGLGGKFPIVEFDYNAQYKNQERTDVWNPYVGLISQADHLIVTKGSQSMISEALAAGRTVYTTDKTAHAFEQKTLFKRGYVKDLFSHRTGKPLKTESFAPIDVTAACADELILQHQRHSRSVEHNSMYARIRDMFRPGRNERRSRYQAV